MMAFFLSKETSHNPTTPTLFTRPRWETRITSWPLSRQNTGEASEIGEFKSNAAKANTWQAAEDRGQGGREPGWRRSRTQRCQRSPGGAKAARRAPHLRAAGTTAERAPTRVPSRGPPLAAGLAGPAGRPRSAGVAGSGLQPRPLPPARPPAAAPDSRTARKRATEVRPARAPHSHPVLTPRPGASSTSSSSLLSAAARAPALHGGGSSSGLGNGGGGASGTRTHAARRPRPRPGSASPAVSGIYLREPFFKGSGRIVCRQELGPRL